MKQKEMNPFRIVLAGVLCIGFGFIFGHYFDPDEKISQLALTSAVTGVGGIPLTLYLFYRKNNRPIFGKKPLDKIPLAERLLGLMGISGVVCAATGIICSFFFESIAVGQGAFIGGFVGIGVSGMICGGWELWNRIFPKQASNCLNRMFPKKQRTFLERINRID